jgi:hypothetical protein
VGIEPHLAIIEFDRLSHDGEGPVKPGTYVIEPARIEIMRVFSSVGGDAGVTSLA